MFIFRNDWGSFLFAVAVSTSGYDFQNSAGRARACTLNSLWFLESLGSFLLQHMQGPKTLLWLHGCAIRSYCFPSALGKDSELLHAALMAVLCLVNTCTSPCKASPAMWSLPERHRKLIMATMCGVANNTEQKARGVANHHQMTFQFPRIYIGLIFQLALDEHITSPTVLWGQFLLPFTTCCQGGNCSESLWKGAFDISDFMGLFKQRWFGRQRASAKSSLSLKVCLRDNDDQQLNS